jgi:hypothetical protein
VAEQHPRVGTIYKLLDPRNEAVRYIGQTTQTLKQRHRDHLRKNKSDGVLTWVEELRRLGMEPAMLVVTTCPVAQLDAEELRAIRTYRTAGANLLNKTHNPGTREAAFGQIFRPPGRRDLYEPVKPWPLAMRRLYIRHLILIALSLLVAIALVIAGTIMSLFWSAFVGALFVFFPCLGLLPWSSHLHARQETIAGLVVAWPFMIIGQVLLIVAILASGPTSWHVLAVAFMVLACVIRFLLHRSQALAIEESTPGHIDLDEALQSTAFQQRRSLVTIAASGPMCAWIGFSGLVDRSLVPGMSVFELAGLLVIGCMFFLAATARLWSIPLPRKAIRSLLVSAALAGSFAGFTVMVIEVAFEQDSKLAWFVVLAFGVIAAMALLAGLEGLSHEARQVVLSRENLEAPDQDDEPSTAATLT